mmetsp:Transcript_21308/g.38571  ORF Transcript_21308/g.38571 Transcript_21308/m.38571 type:complete len:202 (-) Transcript_21308:191-796(-)
MLVRHALRYPPPEVVLATQLLASVKVVFPLHFQHVLWFSKIILANLVVVNPIWIIPSLSGRSTWHYRRRPTRFRTHIHNQFRRITGLRSPRAGSVKAFILANKSNDGCVLNQPTVGDGTNTIPGWANIRHDQIVSRIIFQNILGHILSFLHAHNIIHRFRIDDNGDEGGGAQSFRIAGYVIKGVHPTEGRSGSVSHDLGVG